MILAVDIGSSSLRAMLFDAEARVVPESVARRTYSVRNTVDGGAELDSEAMFEAFAAALDQVLANAAGAHVTDVAASSLASSILAVDESGRALTPAFLYSDTRDAAAVEELASRVDWGPIYARTGCPLHTGYLPARFLWIRQTRPDVFALAPRWLSLHEFFLLKLFGRSMVSHSLASWTGLLDVTRLDWDDSILALAGVRRAQLSPLVAAQEFETGPAEEFRNRWPGLADARFFPAVGDGAAANLGSGCTDASRVAVTVGTSGAVRAVIPQARRSGATSSEPAPSPSDAGMPAGSIFQIPAGLWFYRVDERRGLVGGSLSNGGNAFAYLRRTLRLPEPAEEEKGIGALEPDGHGLTLLPFFAGERSPGYHGNARAAIVGLNLETSPLELLRATLEALAYRIAAIFELVLGAIPEPRGIIASGSALLRSPQWVQIIADVLGKTVIVSGEEEATARGAALLALEATRQIRDVGELAPVFGSRVVPNSGNHEKYSRARDRQQRLYSLLLAKG